MRTKSLISLVVAVLATLAVAGSAQAAPFHNGDYGRYAYEGRYPDNTPCTYSLNQRRVATWGGRRITLRYYYSGGCGSFARIDNAPRACTAIIDRSANGGRTWSSVRETVDPGIDFAYTQVGNNLSGRVCAPRWRAIARRSRAPTGSSSRRSGGSRLGRGPSSGERQLRLGGGGEGAGGAALLRSILLRGRQTTPNRTLRRKPLR